MTVLYPLAILCILVIPLFIALVAYLQPRWIISYASRCFPQVLFCCDDGVRQTINSRHADKVIALTIDDSPSPLTAAILTLLRQHDAKATFFVIGSYVEKFNTLTGEGSTSELESGSFNDLMTAIVSHGCELGNHLMFDHASVKLPPAIFEKQLLQVDTLLRKYDNLALSPPRRRKSVAIVDSTVPSGDLPSIPSPTADASRSEPVQLEAPVKYRWFRPGSGWFNSAMLATVEKHGYRTALGCVYPHDPHISNARLNAWHVLRGVHPGAIIVLHDCRSWTIDTLKILLPELRKRGYAVRTLTEVYRSRQVNDGCI